METVRASGQLAQGQMASGFNPLSWKTFKNESHDVKDPAKYHIHTREKTSINA